MPERKPWFGERPCGSAKHRSAYDDVVIRRQAMLCFCTMPRCSSGERSRKQPRDTHRRWHAAALLAAALFAVGNAGAQDFRRARDLADMTLEELSQIRITSVSRRPESLAEAAASVYVITARDIRRSGSSRDTAQRLRSRPIALLKSPPQASIARCYALAVCTRSSSSMMSASTSSILYGFSRRRSPGACGRSCV